jgi:hypothetical protein
MPTTTDTRHAAVRHRPTCLAFGVLGGLAVAAAGYYSWPRYDPVRLRAWQEVAPRVELAAGATRAEAEASAAQVEQFFAERRKGARAFAADVLSLGGKWEFVKGKFDPGSHERYLEECFQRHLFRPDELKAVIESAVARFVSEVQGRENRLLVDIRADLADGEMASPEYLPALDSEYEFRRQFEAMLEEILPIVGQDVGATVTREMVSFVGSEIAAQIVAEIGTSLAVRLGLSGGILGTGAYSGTVTFGIGLVAGILVDMALDWIIRQAGYDPEGEIAVRVEATLARLESLVLDGPTAADFPDYDPNDHPLADPRFRALLIPRCEPGPDDETLGKLFLEFRAIQARTELARAAHEAPGTLGLRNQLRRLDEGRSKLREAALRRLILEGGAR